jgi:hypothetical protein
MLSLSESATGKHKRIRGIQIPVRLPRHAREHNRLVSRMSHPCAEVFLATEECCWELRESLYCHRMFKFCVIYVYRAFYSRGAVDF